MLWNKCDSILWVKPILEAKHIELEQKADLVHEMYLNVRLPSLNSRPQENPDYFVSYVNGIGNALIRYVDEIGGLRIDRHYGQWYRFIVNLQW